VRSDANSYLRSNAANRRRPAEALKLHEEEGLKIRRRVLPQDDPDRLMSIVNLSSSLMRANRADEALTDKE
jgi:hypothetical protein